MASQRDVGHVLLGVAALLVVLGVIIAVVSPPVRQVSVAPSTHGESPIATPTPIRAVRVEGNRLAGASGRQLRLLGVNRSGAEYACVQDRGIFDGPSDPASIAAMVSWHVNAVRLPLNEDCWLGINGVSASYSGANYRSAVASYVSELRTFGLAVVLDLHWSAPGTELATGQQVMADASHSIRFWKSVAHTFRADPAVIFDLYNEPHGISWRCWRDGCTTSTGWPAAGMQELVDAVRAAGATQPVIASGLDYGADVAEWFGHRPEDPLHQLVAGVHLYNFTACAGESCWNRQVAPLTARVPVVASEFGENDCADTFADRFMDWADRHDVSYLAWSWNTADCSAGPALITSSSGTPTLYGQGIKAHFASLFPGTSSSRGQVPSHPSHLFVATARVLPAYCPEPSQDQGNPRSSWSDGSPGPMS